MKTIFWLCLITGFTTTLAFGSGVVRISGGKVLSNVVVIAKTDKQVKLQHDRGLGWYSFNSIEPDDRADLVAMTAGMKNDPGPGVPFVSDKAMREWLPVLQMYYGLDERGSIVAGKRVSGTVLNVLENGSLLIRSDSKTFKVENVYGSYVDDDEYCGLVKSSSETYKYAAVSGSQKTVITLIQLKLLTEEAVRSVGLSAFPRYVEEMRLAKEKEENEIELQAKKSRDEVYQSKIERSRRQAAFIMGNP